MNKQRSIKRRRSSYTDEFKAEAVKLAQSKGVRIASNDLGVSKDSIRLWMKKHIQVEGRSNAELLKEIKELKKKK